MTLERARRHSITARRCEEIEWGDDLTARERIHRLVDALPDDALDAVERVLAGFSESTITHQAALGLGKAPPGGSAVVTPADAAEQRLHSFFRQFEGRSLADELIAERREEARVESS